VNAILGNVIFWRTLQGDGSLDWRTIHTGKQVSNGLKLGVNIWTKMDPAKALLF
jgi:hypothetical protein